MADERAKLLEEKERLELEQLRENVERSRNIREMQRRARADNERAFKDKARTDAALSASCNHKKGGRDYASTQKRGDGDNYSVIIHSMPLGNTVVLCTRCLFLWEPGTTAKFLRNGKTPNPTGISWNDAIRFPTDNTPSGSVLFGQRPAIAA